MIKISITSKKYLTTLSFFDYIKSFMAGTAKLISVIIMLLSFTPPILAGQVMDNKVGISVLEERIRGGCRKDRDD